MYGVYVYTCMTLLLCHYGRVAYVDCCIIEPAYSQVAVCTCIGNCSGLQNWLLVNNLLALVIALVPFSQRFLLFSTVLLFIGSLALCITVLQPA